MPTMESGYRKEFMEIFQGRNPTQRVIVQVLREVTGGTRSPGGLDGLWNAEIQRAVRE